MSENIVDNTGPNTMGGPPQPELQIDFKTGRRAVTDDLMLRVMIELGAHWREACDRKGAGEFVSTHEILGVITEEYQELVDAVHENDIEAVQRELLDIMVGCAHALASIYNGNTDRLRSQE